MSAELKFKIGEDLFVRDPSRFIAGVTNITGRVQNISQTDNGWAYSIAAYIGRMGGYENPPEGRGLRFSEADLGSREGLGTPLSQLSGRVNHPGYDEFKRIAATWGYD